MGCARRQVPAGRIVAGLLAVASIFSVVGVLFAVGATGTAAAAAPAFVAVPTVSAAELTGLSQSSTSALLSQRAQPDGGSLSPSPATDPPESTADSATRTTETVGGSTAQRPAASSSVSATSNPTSQTSTTTSSAAGVVVSVPTSVGATVVPATPPAAAQSNLRLGTVLIAGSVLVAALVVLAIAINRSRRRRPVAPPATGGSLAAERFPDVTTPTTIAPSARVEVEPMARWASSIDGSSIGELVALLVELGDAMVDSGDPVSHVADCLHRVAGANGVAAAEIIVLPTALIISLPGMQESRTDVVATGQSNLRLDQVEAVLAVADAAERGKLGPRQALIDLRAARTLAASFPPGAIVGGHAVIAVGLAVILDGGWTEMAIAAVLGAMVGLIKQWSERRQPATQVFLPVSCALLVTAAAALLARTSLDPAILPPVLGALVTFIPGGLLTTSIIDLTTGQMISGASRFVYGVLQLVLLSLGILGGLQLVGLPAVTVLAADSSPITAVAPWLGVLVFGVGVLLSYSARAASLGWMLLVLYVAFAAQVIGGLLFGNSLSAFIGAAVMTPVAVLVATQKSGPPTLVTFLPAFWLLVPGAIALVGVTQVMSDAQSAGVSSILGAGITITSIALGVVLGLGIGDGVKRLLRRPETMSL